jgi:hypothetical protein
MIKRLTERDEYGNADIIGVDSAELQLNLEFDELNRVTDALNRLAAYEDSGLTPEQVHELAKAEAEGRLVVLPCKPGDVVYAVSGCLFYRDDSAPYTPCEVVVIKKTKRGVIMHLRPLCEDSAGTRYHRWFGLSSIGKTVFLTKEEAEKALEEGLKC